MATESHKLARWAFLDSLLSKGEFLSLEQIMVEYHRNPEVRKPGSDLVYLYRASLRKDLDLFKDTLSKNGLENQLESVRAQEDKRSILYRYRKPGFTIMPYLTGGMTAGEYRTLVKALARIKDSMNAATYEELRFAVLSRVEADYDKGCSVVYQDNLRLKGRGYLPQMYRAITEKRELFIKYRKFDGDTREYHLHPYLLKQYNERWFVFGLRVEKNDQHAIVPVDRIEEVVEMGKFNEDIPKDYMDYFSRRVGVSHRKDEQPHKIRIAVRNIDAWGRITTKPLPTQKVEKQYDPIVNYGEIELELFPNIELFTNILSWGEGIEILGDEEVRAEFVALLKSISSNYTR